MSGHGWGFPGGVWGPRLFLRTRKDEGAETDLSPILPLFPHLDLYLQLHKHTHTHTHTHPSISKIRLLKRTEASVPSDK